MPNSENSGPAIDAIMVKVLDGAPVRLPVDAGPAGLAAARQQLRDLPRRPVHPELRVEDHTLDRASGPPIPVRIYWPPNPDDRAVPATLYFHGGGFVMGDLDTHDATARRHAVGAGAVVVSVDYRLAPEHPYPAAVEDAWAATCWVAQHADSLGVDAGRLAVAGDSAGGTLAAVVAQRARDDDGPPIAFQLLWYPSTMWDQSLPSFTKNANAPFLDAAAIAAFSRLYAGDVSVADPPVGLAPGRALNLTGLPPAYIGVAGHDPLHDDGVRYSELLANAGVPVELDDAETLVHGYLGYAGVVPTATAAMDRGLAALRAALHE